MPTSSASEILVFGGGPAGCAAARLLAAWGHDVLIVTKPEAEAPAMAESLPPSCRKLWSVLGAQQAIDEAGFVRATGNTVWWGGEGRVESFDGGALGWQVTDAALARVLLGLARIAGARVETRLLTDADAANLPAAFRLDCSGRTGLLARGRGGRRYEQDLRTVALTGTWRHPSAWPVPDSTHTLLESYADGWAWSVPLADDSLPSSLSPAHQVTRRSVAVMVDPRTTDLLRGHGARDIYLAEIAKTDRFRALLAPARLEGRPVGWDASMYWSQRFAGDDWLLVGDAGSFVDPLSSAGVMKALASGWLAAIVAHTCLVRPAMRAVARDFYQAREEEVYAGLTRQTRQFFGMAAGGHAHPFWSSRVASLDAEGLGDLQPDRLRRDLAVLAAFEKLRAAPAIALRSADDVRIEPRPAISGREIVTEQRLIAGHRHEGVRFICDVDVVVMLRLIGSYDQVPDLFEACVRRSGPIALPDFLTALSTLVARGWVVWR